MEEKKTLQEVTKELGISTDKARYWLSLLQVPTEKRGRVVYLSDEAIEKLSSMIQLIEEGFTPGEAAKKCKNTDVTVPVKFTPNDVKIDLMPVFNRIEALEKAIMFLVEANKAGFEEVRQMKEEVKSLRIENNSFRSLFAPQQEPAKKLQFWQPTIQPDPFEGKPWHQKMIAKLFYPEKLRRF